MNKKSSDLNSVDANITVKQLQDYIWKVNKERGFDLKDPSKKLVMLIEEVGELAKSIRKAASLKFTKTTKQTEVEEELADVQIVLLGLASLMKVDMVDAVSKKELKNQKRKWK